MDALNELQAHTRYLPVRLICEGRCGSVVQAWDREAGNYVALKFLKKSEVGSMGLSAAEKEVLSRVRLHHPGVIALSEVFLTEESVVFALEYAEGTLAQHIPAGAGLPQADCLWLFQQLLFALEYCHRMGIATRDLRVENILLSYGQNPSRPLVKLGDFGLSTQSSSSRGLLGHSGAGRPTLKYCAPEVFGALRGKCYIAQKADVWSCGVVLYLMLTGCCPFQRAPDLALDPKARLLATMQRMIVSDYDRPVWLPQECQDILARMLAPNPFERPTIQELLRHPWLCSGGLHPDAVLRCNDIYFNESLGRPLPPEVMLEVRSIFREASIAPNTPYPAQHLMRIPE